MPVKPLIIGLAGRAGSGKTTVAKWLETQGAKRYSIADPLKDLCKDAFGLSEEQVRGSQAMKEAKDPRWGFSPRDVMVRLGHSIRGGFGEDIFVKACLNRILLQGDQSFAVIDDVRYANEAELVSRTPGGRVVLLRCPDAASMVDPDAPSERSVDDIRLADLFAVVEARRSDGARALVEAFETQVWERLK